MQLSNQDLSQLDEEELLNLSEEELRRLSIRLLTDLKEARERLSQNSHNKILGLPSSEAPWERDTQKDSSNDSEEEQEATSDKKAVIFPTQKSPIKHPGRFCIFFSWKNDSKNETEEQRKPGKHPWSQGFWATTKNIFDHRLSGKFIEFDHCLKYVNAAINH